MKDKLNDPLGNEDWLHRVTLTDEVTVVRATHDGAWLGSVFIGERGGWRVRIAPSTRPLPITYSTKEQAVKELLRRI